MAYRVSIDTSAYKDKKCSEKNWEAGTMNDFMHAINGWSVREGNLRELSWRLSYLGNWAPCKASGENYPIYKAWVEKHDKTKNYIKFWDNICKFERKEPVQMYGFAQGYFDIDKVIDEVREKGSAKIPFSKYYDTRQPHNLKNVMGCYILIEKV